MEPVVRVSRAVREDRSWVPALAVMPSAVVRADPVWPEVRGQARAWPAVPAVMDSQVVEAVKVLLEAAAGYLPPALAGAPEGLPVRVAGRHPRRRTPAARALRLAVPEARVSVGQAGSLLVAVRPRVPRRWDQRRRVQVLRGLRGPGCRTRASLAPGAGVLKGRPCQGRSPGRQPVASVACW